MARFEILSTVTFTIILAVLTHQASALECWDCRSEFHSICTEYWDSSKLSSSDKVNRYGTCPSIGKSCMKAVVKNDGATLEVDRGCIPDESTGQAMCEAAELDLHLRGLPNAKVECFFCNKNGCNGAAQYGPIILLVALPVAIAKIFLSTIVA